MATRVFKEEVPGPTGIDWERLVDLEEFLREKVPEPFERQTILVTDADGELNAKSLGEIEPAIRESAVTVHAMFFWEGGLTPKLYASAFMRRPFAASYEFEGFSHIEVMGLAATWKKRLSRPVRDHVAAPPLTGGAVVAPAGGGAQVVDVESRPAEVPQTAAIPLVAAPPQNLTLHPSPSPPQVPEPTLLRRAFDNHLFVALVMAFVVIILIGLAVKLGF